MILQSEYCIKKVKNTSKNEKNKVEKFPEKNI